MNVGHDGNMGVDYIDSAQVFQLYQRATLYLVGKNLNGPETTFSTSI